MNTLYELFASNPLAQIVGILAYLMSAFSVYQKDEKKLRLYMSVAALIWVAHHALLHSYTAAILLFVIAIRCFVSAEMISKTLVTRVYFTVFFILINAFCTYLTWEGYISLFAFMAATVATFAVLLVRGAFTRVLLISVELLWLTYNIYVGSIGGVVACLTDASIMAFVLYKDFYLKRTPIIEEVAYEH